MTRLLTAVEALALLKQGHTVENVAITGRPQLRQLSENESGTVRRPVTFRHCRVEEVDAAHLLLDDYVLSENRTFHESSFAFWATYFLGGAEFLNCTFLTDVSFGCGGHNNYLAPFRLEGCRFRGFVDFFDAWFPGPVEVLGCNFEQGTNLLVHLEVLFDVPPVIQGNLGNLTVDESFRRNT